MAVDDGDTAKTAVRTYVPAYQRDIWDEQADELDMSRSEFVRTMVQAGRRDFDPGGNVPETTSQGNPESADDKSETTPGAPTAEAHEAGMEDQVLDLLAEDCLGWDEIVEALTEDVERRLEGAIESLQDQNAIQHKPRQGGYVRVE